jgi:thioredoxin reductase (NADPH)
MKNTDLVVIGAGAAGLTAGQYGARAGLDTLVLEQLSPGGQALQIDTLENYPGLFPAKNGFDVMDDMRKQAEAFGARIESAQVVSVERIEKTLCVKTAEGAAYAAKALVLATGAAHRTLGVPGEAALAGSGVSYCATCDGPFFRNKRIFVSGGGDAACDEALYLARLSPAKEGEKRVILVHRRDTLRAQKAVAARVLASPDVEVRFNTRIAAISGAGRVQSVLLEKTTNAGEGAGETREEPADAVFIFAGLTPQSALIPTLEKDSAGFIITDMNMASSEPGVFAAGDVRASPFRQVITAASDGAIAAHSAAAYIDTLKKEA